jgi:hypothetical protein
MRRMIRWMFELMAMVGVFGATGCPHCVGATLIAIGGVESVCVHKK